MTHPVAKVVDLTTMADYQQHTTAKEIADTLFRHYPGHLWAVGWQGGSVWIKNLNISCEFGMYIHPDLSYSASELAAKAVRMGGELLERAHMKRGAGNGDRAQVLEGGGALFEAEKLYG